MKSKLEIILLFSIGYAFYYLARYNYPIALPFIKQELGSSALAVGWIATALTAGYAFGQLINGFLVDRIGPRILFTVGAIGAALANILMGSSSVLGMFILAWTINGYFQAMGYPSSVKLIANWFKEDQRGRPLGVSEFMQSLASIIIPVLAAFLAVQFGWRYIFFVPSVLLALTSIVFYLRARNYPPETEVAEQRKPLLSDALSAYKAALSDWRLLFADLSYGCTQFVRYAMITWIPAYLYLQLGNSIFKAAIIAMTFQIGGTIGSLVIGYLSDTKMFLKRRWVLIFSGMMVSGLVGMFVGYVTSAPLIVVMLMVSGAGIEALEVAYFLTPVDYLGKSLTATGVGCMNAVGKAMATLQGASLGFIIDTFGYGSAFVVAGVFGLLAAVLIIPSGLRRKDGTTERSSLS